jgi:LPS export ABC transporter protein LptC
VIRPKHEHATVGMNEREVVLLLPKRLRLIIAASLVLVVTVLVLIRLDYLPLGQGEPPSQAPPSSHPPAEGEPPTQFTGVEFIGRKDGMKQYQLFFDIVKRTEDGGLVDFEGLKDGVIYQEGEPTYGIVARAGQWLEKKDDFELEGDISVTREGEMIFQSQRLQWDGNAEILTVPVPAQLKIDGLNATSKQLEAHVKTDRLYLQGDVVMWDDRHTIRGEQIVYDRQEEELRLIGPGEIEFTIGEATQVKQPSKEGDGQHDGSK